MPKIDTRIDPANTNSFLSDVKPPSPRHPISNWTREYQREEQLRKKCEWPSRLNPCDLQIDSKLILQDLVNQLSEHNPSSDQVNLMIDDLSLLSIRSFCRNHVGASNAIPINYHGQNLVLDAFDLAILVRYLSQKESIHQALEKIRSTQIQQSYAHLDLFPADLEFRNAQGQEKFFMLPERPKNHERQAMMEHLKDSSIRFFDPQLQSLAHSVLQALPPAAQGALYKVPPELISRDAYFNTLREAAKKQLLPPALQKFRDNCNFIEQMKIAIYSNPWIAATLLNIAPVNNYTPRSTEALTEAITTDVLDSTKHEMAQRSVFSQLAGAITSKFETQVLVEKAFSALGKLEGFQTQATSDVHTCFDEVICPLWSALHQPSPGIYTPSGAHANYIDMGNNRRAIAAMQPAYTPKAQGANPTALIRFYEMLAAQPNTTVLDLRSVKDFQQGSYDYCPAVGCTTSFSTPNERQKAVVKTLSQKELPDSPITEVKLSIQIDDQPAVEVKALQFRQWPDQGVVSLDQLSQINQVVRSELDQGRRLITHCRAGVGRTGTVLAYENIRHRLIENLHGRRLLNEKGEVNKLGLLKEILRTVVAGRLARGPMFVQTLEQFRLLFSTIKSDLKGIPPYVVAHKLPERSNLRIVKKPDQPGETMIGPFKVKNKKPSPETPPTTDSEHAQVITSADSNQSAAVQNALIQNTLIQSTSTHHSFIPVQLEGQHKLSFSAEPASASEAKSRWQSLLDQGENSLEIISDPKRAVGPNYSAQQGLGSLLHAWLNTSDPTERQALSLVGQHQLLSIQPISQANTHQAATIHPQQFEIRYRSIDPRTNQSVERKLIFTQILTSFDGKKLNATQLSETLNFLADTGGSMPSSLSSVMGKGRPSALAVANAVKQAVSLGVIHNEQTLRDQINRWIAQGRATVGPMFIHTTEQKEQLIQFGKELMHLS